MAGALVIQWADMWVIIGLGNPGNEYARSRHNVGRDILMAIAAREGFSEWKAHATSESLVVKGTFAGAGVTFVLPETFMNKSGRSAQKFVKSPKAAARLVVIHDDIDLPIGRWKFAFDRGSAGHRGVESIMRALKTKAFVRVRVGVTPTGFLSRKLKKPAPGEGVVDFVLGKFSPGEQKDIARVTDEVRDGLVTLLTEGPEKAMGEWNKKR